MFNKLVFLTLFLVVFANQGYAQSLNNLKEINKVWMEFYQAFDSLDYKPMARIHSKNLVRVSGGERILDYDTYINNYKSSFKKAKEDKILNNISLRFFERINNDSTASERGIYKLTRTEAEGSQQAYYGQFHVIFVKEDGMWRILVDYDSNPENSIGEKDYINGYAIDELDAFILE